MPEDEVTFTQDEVPGIVYVPRYYGKLAWQARNDSDTVASMYYSSLMNTAFGLIVKLGKAEYQRQDATGSQIAQLMMTWEEQVVLDRVRIQSGVMTERNQVLLTA